MSTIGSRTALPTTPAVGDSFAVEHNGKTYKIDYNALASAIIAKLGDPVGITHGGFGGTTAEQARNNLGITPENIGALPDDTTAEDIGGLPASGGDVTGDINITGSLHSTNGTYVDSNFDYDTPSADARYKTLAANLDTNNIVRNQVYALQNPNGSYATMLQARDNHGVQCYIGAGLDANGDPIYYISAPLSLLSAIGVQWEKVTGTTSAGGTVGLGLAKNRYMVVGVWSSVDSGNSHICTPLVSAGGTNWLALVETVAHAAVANTAVTLYVGYIDFGAGNIS